MEKSYVQLLVVATLLVAASYTNGSKITEMTFPNQDGIEIVESSINGNGCANIVYRVKKNFDRLEMRAVVKSDSGERDYNINSGDCAHKSLMEKLCKDGSPHDGTCDDANTLKSDDDGLMVEECCANFLTSDATIDVGVFTGSDELVMSSKIQVEG